MVVTLEEQMEQLKKQSAVDFGKEDNSEKEAKEFAIYANQRGVVCRAVFCNFYHTWNVIRTDVAEW